MKNGFAYEVDGSVYFDTVKFDRDPGHTYCKLEPKSAAGVKQASAMQEGSDDVDTADRDAAHALANAQAEGELSQITPLAKRHPADFALWKQSKLGEPRWDSPWGSGRPGWHIECSVMASSVFGSQMDIHSGGIDLAFPHHDNEIAQAESHYNCGKEGWVRHFVHTGHLHIQGLKMSKSLKNFKTIQEALQETSADQLRLLFLSRAWEQTLDYSSGSVQEAKNLETTITNFLDLVKAHQQAAVGKPHAYAQAERDLVTVLDQSKQAVRAALLDSFNTVGVMQEIKKLIVGGNAYLKRQGPVNVDAVGMYAAFISRMLKIFGLVLREGSSESQDQMFPVVKALAEFRDSVRTIAKSTVVKGGGDKEAGKELLELCDRVRDVDLVELGVQLDDQDGIIS